MTTQNAQTPAELLASNVALTTGEVAYVLRLTYVRGAKKGQPNRRLVIDKVTAGELRPIDPTEPWWRWKFSVTEVNRYLGAVAA